MTRKSSQLAFAVLFSLAIAVLPSKAANIMIMKSAVTDGLRIELHVMPAEPFYTADQVRANPALEGMLIVGGEKPLAPDAQPHPNCHLIAHVFDTKTGKPLTDAKVIMSYQPVKRGKLRSIATRVPVVIMQVIGKGSETTHYGNNVVLPHGTYAVTVVANGKKAVFRIAVP